VSSGADSPGNAAVPPVSGRRRRYTPYFQRPGQPHDWRWVVGGIGKGLITLGLLMFAFVAYQLWGTGIQTAQAQDDLAGQFQHALQATTTIATTTSATPTTSTTPSAGDVPGTTVVATTSTVPTAPADVVPDGEAVARMVIPKIGLDWYVVEGVSLGDLAKGPGHFHETPMPGQLGNAAIAGHRTTHGAPFYDLDRLAAGDPITITTKVGTYTYRVTGTEVVSPTEYAKVIPTTDPSVATLTLATCNPRFSTSQRLIVHALLVPEQSGQVFAPAPAGEPGTSTPDTLPGEGSLPVTTPGPPGTGPANTLPVAANGDGAGPDGPIADAFSQGWFDDTGAIPHVVLWGLLLAGVTVGAYHAGKRAQRLYVSFIAGCLPFVVVLYFFFENVSRLLPAGI
jgi:sortase A